MFYMHNPAAKSDFKRMPKTMPTKGSTKAVPPKVTAAIIESWGLPVPNAIGALFPTVTTIPKIIKNPEIDCGGINLPIFGKRPQNSRALIASIMITAEFTG